MYIYINLFITYIMTRELLSSYINLQWSQWNFRDFLVLLDESMTHKISLFVQVLNILLRSLESDVLGISEQWCKH